MKKNDFQLFSIEFIIVLWYIHEILIQSHYPMYQSMMVLLIYLCCKVLYYIYRRKNIAFYLSGIIVFYLIMVSIQVIPYMTYFILFNAILLVNHWHHRLLPLSLLALIVGVIVNLNFSVFLVINTLVFVATLIITWSSRRITFFQQALEAQREDHHRLTAEQLNMSIHESNMAHHARLEERNLIAQQLHDELGHTLSGNTMQLEAALLISQSHPEKSQKMIQDVIGHLREGSESIRKILKNIQPEQTSLGIQTIKTMISKVKEKSAVHIDLIYNNEVSQLDYQKWHCITLNIQESLTNMMKYSKATTCSLKFQRLNTMFKVTIQDNGIGCENITKHMGLQGMEERVTSQGGQLIVDGSKGFTVIMLLPIEKGQ